MAIDITTNQDEGSSAFGERLLGNVRETNRASEKAFFKRQKREKRQADFTEAGIGFGVGLANSFIDQNTQDLLATEAQAGNVLATRKAHKFSEQIASDIKKIAGYKGGKDAYWNDEGEARARAAIEADIAKKFGTTFYYNKELVDVQVKSIGSALGKEMRQTHDDRVNANNNYMSSVGVEDGRDAYITAIKSTQPKNITDVAGGLLKKLMGMSPDERINATASNILETSEQLNDFQQLYENSGDAVLSAALAREFPEGKDLGSPIATIGNIVKEQTADNFLGDAETRFVVDVTRKAPDGSLITVMMYVNKEEYQSTGNIQVTGEVTSPTQIKNRKDFGELAATVLEKPEYINFGAQVLAKNINSVQLKTLNTQIQDLAKGKGGTDVSRTDIGKNQEIIEKTLHGNIAAATFIISKEADLSLDEAGKVTMQMFNDNPSLGGQGAFAFGTGSKTPFATLNAIIKTESAGDLRYSRKQYDQLAGNNGETFVSAYISSTANERKSMEKNLEEIMAHGKSDNANPSVPYAELEKTLEIAKQINAGRDADLTLSQEIAIRRQVMDSEEKEKAETDKINQAARDSVARAFPDEVEDTTPKPPSYYTGGDAPTVGDMSLDNLAVPLTPTGNLPKLWKFQDMSTWIGYKELEPQAKAYVEIKEAIENIEKLSSSSSLMSRAEPEVVARKQETIGKLEANLAKKYQSYQKQYGDAGLTPAQQKARDSVAAAFPDEEPEQLSLLGVDPTMFRSDGTTKSTRGFLGPVENSVTGAIMTEFSTDLGDPQSTPIPTLVPGQSDKAVEHIQNMKEGQGFDTSVPIEREIVTTARKHAEERIDAGLSPFYTKEEDKGTIKPIPKSVEEKIEYVGNLLGDSENGIQFMKRVVNQESRFGKHEGTYKISADGKGSFGVAQVDKVAFDAVQRKLKSKNSKYNQYVKTFKDATGMDLTKVEYKALGNDTLSIVFGRLYLMQLTEEAIPTTLTGQAAYWKKYYNTAAGEGTASQFIRNND